MVAYTDGITEAQNRHGDFWGQQRLEDLLRSSGHKTPAQVIEAVLNEVKKFGDGQPQHDDITVVVLRVQAGYSV